MRRGRVVSKNCHVQGKVKSRDVWIWHVKAGSSWPPTDVIVGDCVWRMPRRHGNLSKGLSSGWVSGDAAGSIDAENKESGDSFSK